MPSRNPNKTSKPTHDEHQHGDDWADVVTIIVFRSPQKILTRSFRLQGGLFEILMADENDGADGDDGDDGG
eukprot:10953597-Karenia_brevis.AAC.1